MITVNIDFINDCIPAVSKELSRYYLQGVNIKDVDGWRHYCATNGHIIVHCKEAIGPDDGSLGDQQLIVKIDQKLKTRANRCEMVINDDFVTFKLEKVESFNLIDGQYPDYEKVIPVNPSEPEKFSFFSWKYLKIVNEVLGENITIRQNDCTSPAVFTNKDIENVEIALMPIRIKTCE